MSLIVQLIVHGFSPVVYVILADVVGVRHRVDVIKDVRVVHAQHVVDILLLMLMPFYSHTSTVGRFGEAQLVVGGLVRLMMPSWAGRPTAVAGRRNQIWLQLFV